MAETGSLAPGRQGRPRGGGKLAAYRDRLIGWVEAEPDISMPELAARLEAECGVVVHPASLSRLLLAAGFTVKEKRCWRTKPLALTLPNGDGHGGADASRGCAKSRTGWSSPMKRRPPPR
jgi:transposase